jgi:hypothetical protein
VLSASALGIAPLEQGAIENEEVNPCEILLLDVRQRDIGSSISEKEPTIEIVTELPGHFGGKRLLIRRTGASWMSVYAARINNNRIYAKCPEEMRTQA